MRLLRAKAPLMAGESVGDVAGKGVDKGLLVAVENTNVVSALELHQGRRGMHRPSVHITASLEVRLGIYLLAACYEAAGNGTSSGIAANSSLTRRHIASMNAATDCSGAGL